ncbi:MULTISPECIES: vWA domain-containing protein [Cupriavidus]
MSHRQAAADSGQGGNRWQAPRFAAPRPPQGRPAGTRVHWPRTLAAKGAGPLAPAHLRLRAQHAHAGVLHCFVLDCSASMLQGRQLALAKGVLLRLLQRAYQARAEVALVCFAGTHAEVRLQPARARPWSETWIRPIAGGGGTPLALGMRRAGELLARAGRRRPAQQRWLWLLSDGRSAEQPARPRWADAVMVVDFEQQAVALGRCQALAAAWHGDWLTARALME